jgi:hypothetical protein
MFVGYIAKAAVWQYYVKKVFNFVLICRTGAKLIHPKIGKL